MSIYTIKLNDPGNDDFQLLGVVTKAGMESDAKKEKTGLYRRTSNVIAGFAGLPG